LLAPASKAALLKNPSGAHLRRLWSTLTSILFGQKVFRLFCPKGNCCAVSNIAIGRADVVEQSAFVFIAE